MLTVALRPAGIAAFGSNLAAGIVSSAVIGGITDGVEGALFGAARAAVTYGIGSGFEGFADAAGNFSAGELLGKAAAHAASSGAFAAAQGGEFGPAALSAGFSVFVGGYVQQEVQLDMAAGFVVHSTIGGTAAVIGGGKFQNGAATAGFVWWMNDSLHRLKQQDAATARAQNSLSYGEAAHGTYLSARQAGRELYDSAVGVAQPQIDAARDFIKSPSGVELADGLDANGRFAQQIGDAVIVLGTGTIVLGVGSGQPQIASSGVATVAAGFVVNTLGTSATGAAAFMHSVQQDNPYVLHRWTRETLKNQLLPPNPNR